METYQELFSQVRTKDDLEVLTDELEAVKNSLYRVNSSVDKTLHDSVRERTALALQRILASSQDQKNEIDKIIEASRKLSNLNLKIAFEPTEKTIDKIYAWVSTNVGEGIVLNFEYDPAVLGGAEISFNGKYIDLTLKKALEGYKFI